MDYVYVLSKGTDVCAENCVEVEFSETDTYRIKDYIFKRNRICVVQTIMKISDLGQFSLKCEHSLSDQCCIIKC